MEWLDNAINTLKAGGIIVFPTDTVYGLGCDSTIENAVERIYKIKRRSKGKPLIVFIATPGDLDKIAIENTELVNKLIKNFWPGPLTLILKAKKESPIKAKDGTVGVRIPDEEHMLTLLRNYKNPLATTSCNVENLPILTNTSQIKKVFGDNIDYVIEGDTPDCAIPSTVVSVSPPKILRKGKVSLFEIEQKTGIRFVLSGSMQIGLLFVCSANLCRSQIAEGFANKIKSDNIFIGSAGIYAVDGSAPSLLAKGVMTEIGIDISGQSSSGLTRELLYSYDLILCMTEEIRQSIISFCFGISGRVFLLSGFCKNASGKDIEDPIGGGIEQYRIARDIIKKEIERVFDHLDKRYLPSRD